jgi:uncharacterized membrane protein YfcA
MLFHDLLLGIGVGLVSGATAGLLGVSPGGGLVIFSVLLLGAEQHAAQGISLVAQVVPAGLSGIRRYWNRGNRAPLRWLILLTIGFVVGGLGGALAAGGVSSVALQWTYVVYLVALDALMIFRSTRKRPDAASPDEAPKDVSQQAHWLALLVIGSIAGFSSGFLGIGGGLALTVGLSAGLKVPQHQAQLVSLMLAIIPTTIPAAYVYLHQGWLTSWLVMAGVIAGLWAGTDIGARLANQVSETALRRILIGFVSAMTIYMAYKALASVGISIV